MEWKSFSQVVVVVVVVFSQICLLPFFAHVWRSDDFEKTPKKEMPKKSKNFDALKNVTKTPKIPINITH